MKAQDHEKREAEGVIRFRLDHQPGGPAEAVVTAPLRAWFVVLRRLALLGRDPARYLGYAYGNLSRKVEKGFWITCTQTAGRHTLAPDHFTRVSGWDLAANRLRAQGPCRPSSEALTHAVVYEAAPSARFVFHVHSPTIWCQAEALGLAVTDPNAEYGTPAMAEETLRIIAGMGRPGTGALSMGGHEDGILAWGETAEAAGTRLVALLAAALEHTGE